MKELFTLGELCVSDFINIDDSESKPQYELKLMLEEETGAVRLEKPAPSSSMYGKYWYRSGINQTMRDELKNVVESILKVQKLKENDIWIDVATNDGTLFDYVPENIIKIGIDPADDSYKKESEKRADLIIQDYFSYDIYKNCKFGNLKAKIITVIAMFYDLDNPDIFLQDIYKILDDEGLLVMQMSYTPLMIKQMAFDNICFKPNTIINGINKKISEIEIGDYTIGYNGKMTKILKKFERDYDGIIYKIKSEYLDYIEPTPEHPIWVVKKNNIDILKKEWIKAKDTEIGDYVVVPKPEIKCRDVKIDLSKYNNTDSPNYRRGLKEIILNEDILWMMGLYVAEGHTFGRENNLNLGFTLSKKETDFIDRLEKIFASIGYKIKNRNSKVSNGTQVSISCTALAKMFREWFGKGALNKKIPDEIFFLEDKYIIPFIKGIIDGDGYFNNYLNFHTSSKILLAQLQSLLSRLNIMTTITRLEPRESVIRGKIVKCKESWLLRGSNKIISQIFETHGEKSNKLRYYYDDNYVYVKIKNIINEHYTGKVYNIETENNTYVTSNMVVHNCHEHIYYYSFFNIKKLLNRNGFRVVDCILNDINGGSFRLYIKKNGFEKKFHTQPYRDVCDFRMRSLLDHEKTLNLDKLETWLDFYENINTLKEKTVNFIKDVKNQGKTVWAYGASTKGNTTLQYFGLDSTLIDGIAERSPYKWGLKTSGTNIPIYSEDQMRRTNPDYLFILPWHFINEFKEREKDYLARGGKFIVPCPKFEIIGY